MYRIAFAQSQLHTITSRNQDLILTVYMWVIKLKNLLTETLNIAITSRIGEFLFSATESDADTHVHIHSNNRIQLFQSLNTSKSNRNRLRFYYPYFPDNDHTHVIPRCRKSNRAFISTAPKAPGLQTTRCKSPILKLNNRSCALACCTSSLGKLSRYIHIT